MHINTSPSPENGAVTDVAVDSRNSLPLQRKVLSARYAGYDVSDIAHMFSLSVDTVQRIIDSAVSRQADEIRAEVVREAELAKLEEMEPVFFEAALQGSHKAAATVLKFMERRSALLGVDKQVVQSKGNVINLVQILANMSENRPKVINGRD